MILESKFLGPKLEQRGHRQRVYVCMYGERAGGRGEEEERSCPRRRRRRVLLLLLPSPLGAPERATDRSYASHPSMSSELLLSSVSLLSLPLPLSSLVPSISASKQPLPSSHFRAVGHFLTWYAADALLLPTMRRRASSPPGDKVL